MKKLLLVSLCFLMLGITQVFAQNRTVTGTVTAKDDGLPIPGVTVKVKGTTTAISTNAAGKYSLSVPSGAVLEFTSVGYNPLSAAVKTAVLNVSLDVASQQLGEVVVTGALNIKTQAKELGYATATIGTKELTQAKVTDISTGLEGKVSGLQINLTDNGVDPSTRIVLRGNRSITGNNEALLVVDGVPIEDDSYINTINPEDVASVTILKGAVAAAIYGSKASNGVLIITTKKGTKGKASLTVSNTTEIQSVSYLPDLQTRFGSYGGEPAPYTNADGTTNAVPYENQQYGPAYNGETIPLALSNPTYGPDGVTVLRYDTLYTKYSPIKNNIKDFFNNAITNQFNIGFDIGDDNSTFHLGFQDADINGVVPNDVDHRDNIRIGGTRSYGKFSVEYNASYNQSNISTFGSSYDQTGGGLGGDALYFDVLNIGADIPLKSFENLSSEFGNVNSYYNAYAVNPYWTVQNSRDNTTNYDILASMNLAYKVTSFLTISDRIGLTMRTTEVKDTRAQVQFAPWAIADPWKAGNVPSSLQYVYPAEADATYFEQRLNNDLIAAFDKKFGDISLTALVGTNLEQNYQNNISLSGSELQFQGDYNVSSSLGIPGYGQSTYEQRESAVYEEARIGYKDFLFLHVTNRDEWNSVLAPSLDHYEYPGADLSFIFTDAISALKDNNVLSYGKLSGGITKVANINLGGGVNPYGAYSLVNPFNSASGFPFGSLGGYTTSGLALNYNIKPEQTTEYEVGLELGFFKDRLNFKADVYNSKSRDQSLTSDVSTATGYSQQLVNAGLLTNNGQEFDLNGYPVKTRNFSWNLGVNVSHYGNKVIALQNSTTKQIDIGGPIFAVVGKPYPIIETYDWDRDPKSGKVIVDPVTGLPTVSSQLTDYGNTNPTVILGITNSFQYKNWNLAFVLDYRGGNEIFNTIGGTQAFTGVSSQSAENGRQRFIYPNSVVLNAAGTGYVNNQNVAVDNGGNTEGSGFWPTIYSSSLGSIYVDNAAFWKLREATLTYTIPAKALSTVPFIKRASVGLLGRNLLMWRPKSNTFTDPEFSDAGSGNAVGTTSVAETPPTRFYGANLTVTF